MYIVCSPRGQTAVNALRSGIIISHYINRCSYIILYIGRYLSSPTLMFNIRLSSAGCAIFDDTSMAAVKWMGFAVGGYHHLSVVKSWREGGWVWWYKKYSRTILPFQLNNRGAVAHLPPLKLRLYQYDSVVFNMRIRIQRKHRIKKLIRMKRKNHKHQEKKRGYLDYYIPTLLCISL